MGQCRFATKKKKKKSGNLYFTPQLVHQRERRWGADCATFFCSPGLFKQQSVGARGPVSKATGAPLGDGEHTWQTSRWIFTPDQTCLFHGRHHLWYTHEESDRFARVGDYCALAQLMLKGFNVWRSTDVQLWIFKGLQGAVIRCCVDGGLR